MDSNLDQYQFCFIGYESVTPDIDVAFKEFFTSTLSENIDVGRIAVHHLPKLEETSFPYLLEHHDFETTRKYFKNLRFIWRLLIDSNRLFEAETYLQTVLSSIHRFEGNTRFIHKGPMYYFWGGTALLMGQLDKGFLLMHAAYSEELRINEPQITPTFKFITLNFLDEGQYFAKTVKAYANYLSKFFIDYRISKVSSYTIVGFQEKFLQANPNFDVVFSFTHTLARLSQLDLYSDYYLSSGFASQYRLNLLFDLVLVIENALREKHSNTHKKIYFPKLIGELANSISSNLTEGDFIGWINQESEKLGFDESINKLLNRTFPFKKTLRYKEIERDLVIAYLIRNRGAHNVSSSIVATQTRLYKDLLQSLFNVLFLTAG